MKAYTLLELLTAPESDEDAALFVDALREVLFDPACRPQPDRLARAAGGVHARDELRRRADELRKTVEDPAGGWRAEGPNAMIRRDGVKVGPGWHPRVTIDPVWGSLYFTTFPNLAGGACPVAQLSANTLATAVEETDRRWPSAPWWLEIDIDGRGGVVSGPGAWR